MKTIRKDNVVDDFFGVQVADPYRWLENENLQETMEWTDYQNAKTQSYLQKTGHYEEVKKTLTTLYNYKKYYLPQKEGEYYYFYKNDGLQDQPVLYKSKIVNDESSEIVLDPNTLSEKGTAAITSLSFNQDGSLLAYAISYDGSDWQHIKIKNLETGKDYPEVLKWGKFTAIAWHENGKGFYYNRYPNAENLPTEEQSYHNRVYWHTVGTAQEQDELIHKDEERKERSFAPRISDDDRYLLLTVNNGTEPKNEVYYRESSSNEPFEPLIHNVDAYFYFLGNENNDFYFQTNYEAPKGRVIAVNLEKPEQEYWKEVVAETENPISFVKIVNEKFIVCSMKDAHDELKIYDMDGSIDKEIELPQFISIYGIGGKKSASEMFISYTSFLTPLQIIRYNLKKDSLSTVFENEDKFPLDDFETTQVFYPSKDGTKIPMFLTHRKGLELTGNHPVLLYGYGGYSISMTPSFTPAQSIWIQSGGIYAVANIRGGGEYGEEWHKAAILENKQTSFDDFISAAEWLIQENYTNSKKIAIMGGSNGGMLVGACITQRPELFGAALCLVPVTDMLRFQHFTVGRFWTTEFGNADLHEEHFKFLYEYSPLHNVKAGVEYPPALITTADTDDRVVPLHAKKFAATLQEYQTGDNPILLRVEKNAGHGLGKPVSKMIEHDADLYTFLFEALDVPFTSLADFSSSLTSK
ncbi:prolyl oligopeptidase family serine peptidase [Sporosarcina ureilytica]|uniref:prolyl oligopeptidase n=1 Tax=Sporosarcina ureilytica TaxID=298596 RepID=A0A1D8JKP7_9BACL|nr:prolyl oligopeptidase family serine peptidase [Sporosarcina ureilytica]AOV09260.1 S9 family peptidase [Sporosarcina ureilytica]